MRPIDKFEARARLGLPEDEKLVVYAGHVGPEKGTDALIRVAAELKGARLVVVGVEDEWWSADNVIAVPRVPVPKVGAYLFAADALIVPPTAAPLTRYRGTVLPMKLFSYLAAARPIVAPRLPDIEEVLTHDESALLVRPTPAAAAAALTRVFNDPDLADRLAGHAKLLSARYTWAARARTIVHFAHARLDAARR
jgi:glycosyltransferase involved in cell wall biosynthesis